MAEEEPANVFAFPDFDLSTKWLALPSQPQDQFFSPDVVEAANGQPNDSITNAQPSHTAANKFFKIPDALTLPDLNGCDDENDDFNKIAEPLHDITLPDLDIIDGLWQKGADPPPADAEYKTWEAFSFPNIPHAAPLFITEAGPLMYDTAIADRDDPLRLGSTDHLVIQSNPYLAALLAVTLGRGSVFFIWDTKKGSFIPAVEKMRISGYSTEILQGWRIGHDLIPTKVALAKAVDVLLLAIQQQFGERGKDLRSLLQLQSLVEPVESMLLYLRDIIRSVSRMRTDEHVLSQIFTETQALENEHSLLRALMCEVLSRVTEPWTDFAEKWIGVKAEGGVPLTKDGPGKSFVKVQNVTRVDDLGFETEEREYVLDETSMPNFIPPDIALVMFEAGKTLRLLRTHHPEHPLCHIGVVVSSKPPDLKWLFEWKSIENLQNEVTRYENAMLQRIHGRSTEDIRQSQYESGASSREQGMLQVFGNDGTHLEQQLLASIQALDQAPPIAVTQDVLSSLLEKCLYRQSDHLQTNTSDFGLHWSLIPLHSFGPLVTSQARLINREYMKLLFSAHDLKEHLRVQKEFQLLGNGMFCSRLSHALFDPDLETAERRAGVALNGGIMGLRMNGRETWPPASSELRLALMGVLSDTYQSPTSQESSPLGPEHSDLPGDLSFALRDLPPEEIDKCLDPSSLEALDFLRLAYKTPAPLSPILTTVILIKYDRIFKLLLRVLRMLYVVGQLFRDTSRMERQGQDPGDVWLRFRFEAQNLVQSVATYLFDTGIQMPWLQFEKWLDGVQSDIAQADMDISDARVVSPDEVREEHEKMLDRIMTTLLLRKRQQPILALLEDIFRLILRFSRQVQLEVGGKVAGDASRVIIQELYQSFRKKVGVFVTVCHGLSEKAVSASKTTRRDLAVDEERRKDAVGDANTIDRLLGEGAYLVACCPASRVQVGQDATLLLAHKIAEPRQVVVVYMWGVSFALQLLTCTDSSYRCNVSVRVLVREEPDLDGGIREIRAVYYSHTTSFPEIDHNFSKAHRIVTTSVLPLVEQYGEHSKNFWKQFFEASANVSLSGYEELAGEVDETATAEETTVDETRSDYDATQDDTTAEQSDYHDHHQQRPHDNIEDSLLEDATITGSTPRPPATKSVHAQFADFGSPYQALRRELKNEAVFKDDLLDDEDEYGEGTAQLPPYHHGSTTRLPRHVDDAAVVVTTPRRTDTTAADAARSVGREPDELARDGGPEAAERPVHVAAEDAGRRRGTADAGRSVQTPTTVKKRDIFAEERDKGKGKGLEREEISWESDEDDFDADSVFGGMSPPKTIHFALPPSKLLQTPAREASRRIVDDILITAGAGPEESENSPTMVKMNHDILDDSF
ncbi:hypothetical protein CIB48_g11369 [Xylaria polymorpha]|nr:hypothetical protein CIB48_g11369 [Xylaria polymorpha]